MTKNEANLISKQLIILENGLSESCSNYSPRILFDMTVVTYWHRMKFGTGIGRVSLELLQHLSELTVVIPIAAVGDSGKAIKRVDATTMEVTSETVELRAGDRYLMPELHLNYFPFTFLDTNFLRAQGVKCYAMLYDVLPLSMPMYFIEETANAFDDYLKEMLSGYDAVISISKATIDETIEYCKNKIKLSIENPVMLGYFHMGYSNFKKASERPTKIVKGLSNKNNHVFLMVGTLELRKRHEFVLEVFEEIWNDKERNLTLCIIGHVSESWKMKGLVNKLRNHPEKGKRLLFFENAPDSYLDFAYSNSSALIQASTGEGFGLPLVEAGQYGLPIICSDIPVFHEVTDGNALFFRLDDTKGLRSCIERIVNDGFFENVPNSSQIPMLTWEQSTEELYSLLSNNVQAWYAKINNDGSIIHL